MRDPLEVRLTHLEDSFEHVERRLSGVEERLGAVENRVDYLRAEMETGLRKLWSEMDSYRSESNARQHRVDTRFYLLICLIIVMNLTASYLF